MLTNKHDAGIKTGRRVIIRIILTVICVMALLPNTALATGEKEVRQEYDEAGRVKTETTYIDGIATDLTVYEYNKNGNIKTIQHIWDLEDGDCDLEIHYDPYGHGMEIRHSEYDFSIWGLGIVRPSNRRYTYDAEERLTQFEADISWFDCPDEFDHRMYSYHYDVQGRIDTVEYTDSYNTEMISRSSTKYYYNDDGSYTTIETVQRVGSRKDESKILWFCRFDKNGELLKDKAYRNDGRDPYAMQVANNFEPALEGEEFEEMYNWCNYNRYSDHAPSAEDLDEIHADIRYPRVESFYLPYYKYAAVSRNAVKAFIDPNASDVMAASNTYTVTIGEDVVVLAESPGYACVIFPDLERAGWINKDYLTCD